VYVCDQRIGQYIWAENIINKNAMAIETYKRVQNADGKSETNTVRKYYCLVDKPGECKTLEYNKQIYNTSWLNYLVFPGDKRNLNW